MKVIDQSTRTHLRCRTFAPVRSPYTSFPLDLLPQAALLRRRTTQAGQDELWCQVRRRWVATQPEELVRQAYLAHVATLGYPLALMQLERGLVRSTNRLDLLVHDRAGAPWMLAEFKSPEISHLKGVAQLADYARAIRAPWCVVANGREALCIYVDYEQGKLKDHSDLPRYTTGDWDGVR